MDSISQSVGQSVGLSTNFDKSHISFMTPLDPHDPTMTIYDPLYDPLWGRGGRGGEGARRAQKIIKISKNYQNSK